MERRIVAILDYRSSREITEVKRILEKAGRRGKVVPGDWKKKKKVFRSLTVYTDGLCVLQELSAASLVRREKRRYVET